MDSMQDAHLESSQQAIESLEGQPPDKHKQNVEEGDICTICLNGPLTSQTRAVASPCLHAAFDFPCLATWLDEHSTCPLCKREVQFIKHNFDLKGTGFKKYRIPSQPTAHKTTTRPHSAVVSRRATHRPRRPQDTRDLIRPNDALLRRRFIYKQQLRSLHCGTNRISRFVNFTPKTVRTDKELESRARAWIRRELEVFEWTADNREWLLEYLIGLCKTVNLRDAEGKAEKLVGELIGTEFAGVFIHELHAFLRSPFGRVVDFDDWAQYEIAVPAYENGEVVTERRVVGVHSPAHVTLRVSAERSAAITAPT